MDIEPEDSKDPADRFLARKAWWKKNTAGNQGTFQPFEHQCADLTSVAFSPSSYGLKDGDGRG